MKSSVNAENRKKQKEILPGNLEGRNRDVSKALKAYASLVTSADKGAVRIID